MLIKHMPSGLYPGEECGYERKPCYPETGEEVTIECRLDGTDGTAAVWLEVHAEGKHKTVQEARAVRTDSSGRVFYSCSLGVFDEATHVSYRICAKSGDESTATKTFRFRVLRPVTAGLDGGCVRLGDTYFFELKGLSGKPVLALSLGAPIAISVYRNYEIPAPSIPFAGELRQTRGEFTVELSTSPFLLRFYRGDELICRVGGDESPLVIHCDGEGYAGKVTWHMEAAAKCFYGFGEKFDSVNQKGREPLTFVMEKFTRQEQRAYLPVPLFYTEKGFGLYRRSSYKQSTALRPRSGSQDTDVTLTQLCENANLLTDDVVFLGSPLQILGEYYTMEGMPALPPKWVFTPWISSNGWNTQREALEQLDKLAEHSIPAGAMVLEAWSDEETFYLFGGSHYEPNDGSAPLRYEDLSFPPDGNWPSPMEFCHALERSEMRLVLWQIPGLKHQFHGHGEQATQDEVYVIEHKLCVLNDDGTPYRVTDNWFHNSLVPDFTNPEAAAWWLNKRRYLLEQLHVAGFKTDGGEFLFDDKAVFHNGKTAMEMHNLFPQLYIEAYHRFIEDVLGKGKGITLSRSGFSGAHRAPMHWAGDQASLFSEFQAQLTAGLSAGLSGVVFWGFDIGGFAEQAPSADLYLRSAAMAAFCPMMQFHSEPRGGQFYATERSHWNNDRSPWNLAEAHQDPGIISGYRRFANLRMSLLPYLYNEALHCTQNGRPMMAHLVFEYPGDETAQEAHDEYLFGRELLVAPVVTQGARGRQVYLPEGFWYDFWTGERFSGGQTVYCECGLDRIPVFVRDGACIPLNLNGNHVFGTDGEDSRMPNKSDGYEVLSILSFGEGCSLDFMDDHGFKFSYRKAGSQEELAASGEKPCGELLVIRGDSMGKTEEGAGGRVGVRCHSRELDAHFLSF